MKGSDKIRKINTSWNFILFKIVFLATDIMKLKIQPLAYVQIIALHKKLELISLEIMKCINDDI